MLPAHERLGAEHATGAQVGLRLVVHDQLLAGERGAQLADQRQPRARVAVALGHVQLCSGARVLGLVHRDVRVAKQRRDVLPVLWMHGDADARHDVHGDLVDLERARELLADRLRRLERGRRIAVVGQEDGELVAPQPRDRSRVRHLAAGMAADGARGRLSGVIGTFIWSGSVARGPRAGATA
jgi:hypothetical protein